MDYIIEMLNISKTFPGVIANDNISLLIKKGEIHALLGENGAGKSTLMSILSGLYKPDSGTIKFKGSNVVIDDPKDADRWGIGMVHQHVKLVENFSVLENIILGAENTTFGFLTLKKARKKVMELSRKYNLEINPDALMRDITASMQLRIEILKILFRDNEILIFDEPTAVLTPQEIEEFMNTMKIITNEGKSIIFITHKLHEIKEAADRCTILRKGKYIDTVDVAKTTLEQLSEMMTGRKINLNIDKDAASPGSVILNVENLTIRPRHATKYLLNNVNFEVRKNEILCIAGVEGSGQSELICALSGLIPITGGKITLDQEDVSKLNIRQRNMKGIAHIPEDTQKHGLIMNYTLEENLILQTYFTSQFQKIGFLNFEKINEYAKKLIKSFDIRSGQGTETLVKNMSGGNQQKTVAAREIDRNPQLLIAVQPTKGLDVGAIEYIHNKLLELRNSGKGILLISLELDEIMNLSDRILVINDGEVTGEFNTKDISAKELGLYMAASKREVH